MKKKIGTSLIKYEGTFYVVTQKKDVFEVNELGARIYDLCNGINTKEDITKKLSSLFDVDIETLKNDIDSYIDTLYELGLIEG